MHVWTYTRTHTPCFFPLLILSTILSRQHSPERALISIPTIGPAASCPAALQALQGSLPDAGPNPSDTSSTSWLSSLQQVSVTLSQGSLGPLQGSLPEDSQFQPPPVVQCWVGDAPKSFPLQMQHSGRCVLLQQGVAQSDRSK